VGNSFFGILHRRRDFRLLWAGQIVARLGDNFFWLALMITVNELTGSTLAVGLSAMSLALPQFLLGLPAGVLVDRFNRRKVMITSDVVRAVLVLLCVYAVSSESLWLFYLTAFFMSGASAFFFPARQALTPALVSERELLSANALLETSRTLAMLVGAAAAGFAIAYAGPTIAFVLVSVCFAVSAISLLFVRSPQVETEERTVTLQALWSELREGLAFVRSSQLVLGIVVVITIVMLGIGAINVLWVPFMDRLFGVGPEGLGIADSLQGVGMLVGSIAVGSLTSRFRHTKLLAASLILLGLLATAIGFAPTFALVLVLLVLLGLTLPPLNSSASTLVQTVTPDALMGRVNSASGTLQSLATLLSMAVAATLGDLIGVRTVFAVCGAIMTFGGLLGWVLLKEPESSRVTDAAVPAQAAIDG